MVLLMPTPPLPSLDCDTSMVIVGARHGRVAIVMLTHLIGRPCLSVAVCILGHRVGGKGKYRYYTETKVSVKSALHTAATILTVAFLSVLVKHRCLSGSWNIDP